MFLGVQKIPEELGDRTGFLSRGYSRGCLGIPQAERRTPRAWRAMWAHLCYQSEWNRGCGGGQWQAGFGPGISKDVIKEDIAQLTSRF